MLIGLEFVLIVKLMILMFQLLLGLIELRDREFYIAISIDRETSNTRSTSDLSTILKITPEISTKLRRQQFLALVEGPDTKPSEIQTT